MAHHRERPCGMISGEYDLQHLISSVGKRINLYIKPPGFSRTEKTTIKTVLSLHHHHSSQ